MVTVLFNRTSRHLLVRSVPVFVFVFFIMLSAVSCLLPIPMFGYDAKIGLLFFFLLSSIFMLVVAQMSGFLLSLLLLSFTMGTLCTCILSTARLEVFFILLHLLLQEIKNIL